MILPQPIKIVAIRQGECVKCKAPKKEEVVEVELEIAGDKIEGILCYSHLTQWLQSVARIDRMNSMRATVSQLEGIDVPPRDVITDARQALLRKSAKKPDTREKPYTDEI